MILTAYLGLVGIGTYKYARTPLTLPQTLVLKLHVLMEENISEHFEEQAEKQLYSYQ